MNDAKSHISSQSNGHSGLLISRRVLFRSAVATAGGVAAVLTLNLPAEAKMTQKAAAYQVTPNGAKSCANCAVFKAPSSCTLVDGAIVPTGYCKFYAAKAGSGG